MQDLVNVPDRTVREIDLSFPTVTDRTITYSHGTDGLFPFLTSEQEHDIPQKIAHSPTRAIERSIDFIWVLNSSGLSEALSLQTTRHRVRY